MTDPAVILVPGAWMGAWIWEPTARALRRLSHDARTLTLAGLAPDVSPAEAARVRLADHVDQVLAAAGASRNCILVAHSYSGVVVGQAADRLGPRVQISIHLGSFLPVDGLSLLDQWSDSPAARAEEAAAIERNRGLWLPPTSGELESEPDLCDDHRRFLLDRFKPHPGRTVLDPATLDAPVTSRPLTYVALSSRGGDAWASAPGAVRSLPGSARRTLASGHWPMLSNPDALVSLLDDEIRRCYSGRAPDL